MGDHQARKARPQRFRLKSQLLGEPRTKVHQGDIRILQQGVNYLTRLRMPEVQRQRTLAAIAREIRARFHRRDLSQTPGRIALQRLDLDYFSAAFSQELRAEGDGNELAKLNHPDALERLLTGQDRAPLVRACRHCVDLSDASRACYE